VLKSKSAKQAPFSAFYLDDMIAFAEKGMIYRNCW